MASPHVLVVGSANYDLVFHSDRLPKPGETVLGNGFSTHPGGKGANQAVAIGRLGGHVTFVGCVGDDVYGEALKKSLSTAGVSLKLLETKSATSTGSAGILVDSAGMNSIVVAPGANSLVSPGQVSDAVGRNPECVVLCQLEVPLEAVLAAAKAATFLLNPAPARELPPELYAGCKIFTPNETEFEILTGIAASSEDELRLGGKILLDRGVQNVIVTKGSDGCTWISADGVKNIGSPVVKAVDTTAAGDAFNGALALFLSEGRELANAIALANCVGALCVTRRGAQEAMPSREELRSLAGNLY